MKTSAPLHRAAGALLLASFLAPWAYGQFNFDGTTYTQNFDGLPTANVSGLFSATVGTQSAITGATGWFGTKTSGTGSAATNFVADAGSGNSGAVYSYGAASTAERALGVVASGTNVMAVGAEFLNTSGGTITSITISYTAEFWRAPAPSTSTGSATQNTLPFAYGFSGGTATSSNFLTSTLSALSTLDVVGPVPLAFGANVVLNGNVAPNRSTVGPITINGLNWAPNTSLFIRWMDTNDTGNDAGLAIDDFTLSAVVNTGADVPRGAGTTFTASSFGGNAFTANDNAVFNNTAATVSLSGAVTANSLKFTATGYALDGTAADPLTLTSGGISVDDNTVSATISGVLAGTSGLTKTGAGSLALSGANTFTGNFVVAAGTVSIPSGSSGNDAALGNAANDVTVNGTLATTSTLYLGSGRTVGGSGTLQTNPGSSVILDGPVNATALTIKDATALNLNGATNQVGTLAFAQPTYISTTGGELVVTTGLVFNQTSGASTYLGTVNFGSSTRNLQIDGGIVTFDSTQAPVGQFKADNRIIKSGAGTLDLTKTTWTSTNVASGFRLGVQGTSPLEGGQIDINDVSDLGVAQLQFNSGVLNATTPLTFAQGVSIGGRVGSISRPSFAGSALTFSGASSFFNAGGSGDYALGVNNTTTLNGTFSATIAPSSGTPEPADTVIQINGTGTLVIGGNASALLDRIFLSDGVTLAIEGSIGGLRITANSGTTLTGGGTYSGYYIPAGTGIPELYKASNAFIKTGATLAPTGTLAFKSNLTLESGSTTIFSINGATIDTGYDSVDVSIPAGGTATIPSYTLTYGGTLTLDFGATAANGDYSLFTTGANVTRSGTFATVALTGTYSGSLTQSGTTWSGTVGGKTFSFEQTTGVLTVSGGVAPVEAWRSANFPGSTATEGTGADAGDADFDGLSNLLEFATDTDPVLTNTKAKVAGPSPVVVSTVTNVGGTFLTLSYPKNPAATDVTYTIQATNDLGVTFSAVTGGSTSVSGNIVTYTDDVPLNATNARRFLSLKVAH